MQALFMSCLHILYIKAEKRNEILWISRELMSVHISEQSFAQKWRQQE
jgi:hypothetical protein